jgi:hypothetical protein
MADKPTTIGTWRSFWVAAVYGTAAGEAVFDTPAIAAVGTDTKGTSLGHATTARAHPAEPCFVPDSTRIFPIAFAADAVGSIGFEFGFAVQWVVSRDQDVAGKAIESLLTGAVEFLGQTVGGPAGGRVLCAGFASSDK